MLSVIIVASIALAVFLGYKTGYNTGFFLYRLRLSDRLLRCRHEYQKPDCIMAYQHHVRNPFCFPVL